MSRLKITAMLMATIITITPITAQAAAIPYIPPSDAYIWGYIYNALGVTALDDTITDKAEKYWTLYASLVNGVNSALYEDMKQVFHKAKTSRKIELSTSQTSVLQTMAHQAITTGINTDYHEAIASVPYDDVIAKTGLSTNYLTTEKYQRLANQANNKFGAGNWALCFLGGYNNYTQAPCLLYAYPKNLVLQLVKSVGQYGGYPYAAYYAPNGIAQDVPNVCLELMYNYNSSGWIRDYAMPMLVYPATPSASNFRTAYNWGAAATYTTLTAQNQSIIDALLNGVDLILTAHSQVVDGSVDDTKPIVIDLPITLPVPAVTVPDLPAVQDDLGVLPLPLTEDAAATITELQETQTASLGTTGDYQLDLTELFPFCIPFDIARVIGLFVAEPQTPVFQFMFPVGYEDSEFIFQTFEMDLAALDGVAVWVRRGMLAVFVVGLGMVTRQVFLRG